MMEQFGPELRMYYSKVKEQIQQEHKVYVDDHPEIRNILNDFISSLLLKKPENIYDFAKDYFSYYNTEKQLKKLPPIIVCGFQQAGAKALNKMLMDQYGSVFEVCIKWTTKKQLSEEKHGTEYYFKSNEEFQYEIQQNGFINYQQFGNNYFGIHKQQVNMIRDGQKVCIFEADLDEAEKLRTLFPDAICFYAQIISRDQFEKELSKNSDETKDSIKQKLNQFDNEFIKIRQLDQYKKLTQQNINEAFNEYLSTLKNKYQLQ